MSEPWNQWYPHEIDIWQGSGAIQILSDTAYRAVHNIIMEMWKSEDCALEEKELHQASRVLDRYAGVRDEVLAYMDRTEDGRITHFVQRKKWERAKLVYEARQSAAKKTNKTKPKDAVPSKAPRSAKQSAPIAARSADTLRVTETLTTTKKVQVPSRPAVEGDSRHVPFKLACEMYAKHMRVGFAWDASEAKQLALLLKACPALTLPQFQACLNHRARSPGVPHGDRPRSWLPHILKYQEAPLNEFGKTGGNHGNSKTAGNPNAAMGAFAILDAREANRVAADKLRGEQEGVSGRIDSSGGRGPIIDLQPG